MNGLKYDQKYFDKIFEMKQEIDVRESNLSKGFIRSGIISAFSGLIGYYLICKVGIHANNW